MTTEGVVQKELAEEIQKAIVEWRAEQTGEVIRAEVRKVLDEHKQQVIAGLLGFSNRWNKWEVDHTNGRKSPITQALEERLSDIVEEWLQQALTPTPKLTATMAKTIRTEFVKEAHYKVERAARERAGEYVDDLIATRISMFGVIEKLTETEQQLDVEDP